MKRIFPLLALTLLLTACGSSKLSYKLEFKTPDTERQNALAFAMTRVVERQLASMGEEPLDLNIESTDEGGRNLKIKVADTRISDELNARLTNQFVLQFMLQAEDETTADLQVEGHGGFSLTGIGGEHLEWLEPQEEPNMPGKGRIIITFTEEGRNKMEGVFNGNGGKYLGLFVREHLAAKLMIDDQEEVKKYIVISELPTVELAHVFADDVNTGLYVVPHPE